MPWEQTDAMNQRMQFISDRQKGEDSMAELCRRYGVQRRIGYKWVERFEREGPAGLADRSPAPLDHPNRTPDEVVARILKLRRDHPLWGAPKIRALLARRAGFGVFLQQPERKAARRLSRLREMRRRLHQGIDGGS